jgi:hypothetical protein
MVFIGSGQAAWGAGCVMRVTMHPTATTLHLCGWLQKFGFMSALGMRESSVWQDTPSMCCQRDEHGCIAFAAVAVHKVQWCNQLAAPAVNS